MNPYEEGQLAYKSGISFFDNPWFARLEAEVPELRKVFIKKWAKGWGDAQIEASQKKFAQK